MDNYFTSYTGRGNKHRSYIIPEFTVISNTTNKSNLVEHEEEVTLKPDAFRITEKFKPIAYRISHSIDLSAFVIGPTDMFYEVWEGIYEVTEENGVKKLKVKKQYGK